MKLRLLKVIVQPVFVLDDGEGLVEQIAQPVSVNPLDWPGYATGPFADELAKLKEQVASNESAPTP